MNTRKVTMEYRLSQWMQILQERQSSGQTIDNFCQEKGLSKNAYFYWQRKIREVAYSELTKNTDDSVNLVPSGWMQLSPKQIRVQQSKATLDIEISGCHISVNAETDLELLKKICRVLKSL